jgi:hypothetical protein
MSSGYVYVAHFPNQDNLVKIGQTKDPYNRSKTLNSTSLPMNLKMAKWWPVANAKEVEKACHKHPDLKPHRNPGKEWFNVSIEAAIKICEGLCVGFTNKRFDLFFKEFKKLNLKQQKDFIVQYWRRYKWSVLLLTEFERENPGHQDNNRSQMATVSGAGVHPDTVKFWMEWHTLSKSVKEWSEERPLDRYIKGQLPVPYELSWKTPLKEWIAEKIFFPNDDEIQKRILEHLEEAKKYPEFILEESAIKEQLFRPACSRENFYRLRMDPISAVSELWQDWLSNGGQVLLDFMVQKQKIRLQNFYDESRKEYRSLCDQHEKEQRALQEHKSFVEKKQKESLTSYELVQQERQNSSLEYFKAPIAFMGGFLFLFGMIAGSGWMMLGGVSLILFSFFSFSFHVK